MPPVVTVGIPIYRRVRFLPDALRSVAAQDYPAIELVVSNNGPDDLDLATLIPAHYHRPFRLRRTPQAVSAAQHFNQIIDAATGKYFVLLGDDDEITPNFISELVTGLERTSNAALAIGRVEVMSETGETLRSSSEAVPEQLRGPDFVRAVWGTNRFGFECFVTAVAHTALLRAIGGFPDFVGATHDDDAVLLRLCLTGDVVMRSNCAFRWRVYQESMGWSLPISDLAASSREFIQLLRHDPTILAYRQSDPGTWTDLQRIVDRMTYDTYHARWAGMYRRRLPTIQWITAAFQLPFDWDYYRKVGRTLALMARGSARRRLTGLFANDRTPRVD